MRNLLVSILLVVTSSAWAGPLQDGARHFQRSDYKGAQLSWSPLAAQGNAVAQNNLGGLYRPARASANTLKA